MLMVEDGEYMGIHRIKLEGGQFRYVYDFGSDWYHSYKYTDGMFFIWM